MNKPFLRTALFYALLSGGFILLDLTIDRLFGAPSKINLPHLILVVVAVLASFILLSRAMETRRQAEAVLRQARDELDTRVRTRTAELERANQTLQNEIKERQLAEQERARSLVQVEYARQHAEALASELQLSNSMLRVSEERYRTQFDNFSEPTTAWDRNGILLMQNLISARNLGGKREDFIGKTIYEIFGAAAKGYMERMVRVMDTGITENQEDMVELHFGKRYFWTCMQRLQNPDGQYAVQIISYDTTDIKRAEEALRASEEKFSTVFHFSPDAIGIVRSADGAFLDVNEAFTKILGYPRSDVLGKTWTELNLIPRTGEQNMVIERFLKKGSVSDYELDFTTREGNVATMLLSLVPITVSGEPCLLAIAHDITKRKQSEKALRQAQAELALGIQERAALEERQRLARELHDSVSQALYGISLGAHTALTLFDTDRPKALEALNYILSLVQAGLTEMRALIFELRPESLEAEGLVTALTKQTTALRARHEIEVELTLCDEPDVPFPTKVALYRIAQEAFHNAIKHGRPSRLDVRLAREPDSLRLEISDNGVGFDPAAAYPGHLGLRSMRERAMRVGGTLDITSVPLNGTQILVWIPLR